MSVLTQNANVISEEIRPGQHSSRSPTSLREQDALLAQPQIANVTLESERPVSTAADRQGHIRIRTPTNSPPKSRASHAEYIG